MLTVEALREYGANVDEGLQRCMNNEAFYLRLVQKAIGDGAFDRLEAQIGAGDLSGAFESAHALKGMLTNLSLTPLSAPVVEITELLRNRAETDYGPHLAKIAAQRARLVRLL